MKTIIILTFFCSFLGCVNTVKSTKLAKRTIQSTSNEQNQTSPLPNVICNRELNNLFSCIDSRLTVLNTGELNYKSAVDFCRDTFYKNIDPLKQVSGTENNYSACMELKWEKWHIMIDTLEKKAYDRARTKKALK